MRTPFVPAPGRDDHLTATKTTKKQSTHAIRFANVQKGSASDVVDDESPVTCPLGTFVDDTDIVLSDLSASTIPWCVCGVTSGAALRFIGWLFSGVLDGAWKCEHMSPVTVQNLLRL